MRDLFGSTSFIKFRVLETILSSNIELKKLLERENDKDFLDYVSNIDSYLYGIILLKVENNDVKLWLNNYIFDFYIPLINKNSLYIVKSYLLKEILNVNEKNSRIDESIKSFIKEINTKIKDTIYNKQEDLKNKLKENLDIDYIKNYYQIYKDKSFIIDLSCNKNIRNELLKIYDFLK